MATDPKLISSLLDLSRNVDKLSGDIKKNTETTSDLVEVQEKSSEGAKDLGKVADSIKGLDLNGLKGEFSQLTKGISGLDFKSLSTDLKSLDFKSLTKDLKSLDFKGLTQGLKGLDFKGIANVTKGLDIGSLAGSLKGGSGGIKDVVSGSLGGLSKGKGKGILGAFEKGGEVKKTGSYIVGEKGPEIVNLNKGSLVIPNSILRERESLLDKLGKNAPTEADIDKKRNELLAGEPDFYKDSPELLEESINYYLSNLDGSTFFNPDDLKKLSKPVANKAENTINPPAPTNKKEIKSEQKEGKLKEKKDGLFSRIFGKNKEKLGEPKEGEVENKTKIGSEIFSKSKDLLKGVDKTKMLSQGAGLVGGVGGVFGDKSSGNLNTASGLLGKNQDLSKKTKLPTLSTKSPELKTPDLKMPVVKPAELKTSIKKLSPVPTPKASVKPQENKDETTLTQNIKNDGTNEITTKQENKSTETVKQSQNNSDSQMTSKDIEEMKAALVRIASLLEGPLNVSPIGSPFRPDSRRI
jgi:hypothetical protein